MLYNDKEYIMFQEYFRLQVINTNYTDFYWFIYSLFNFYETHW
jgi:hypothetical protein